MRHPSTTLTGAELEIMHVVWGMEQATVRDVYETLRERRKVAYTSVMTVLKILEQKGHLKKKQENRAYVYRPARPRAQVVQSMVRDFVDRVFQGAAKPLLVHLVEDARLSPQDVAEIRRLLRKAQ
ncbi:MAG TPA: BlaI/MecI/CopY family transcriptional regulator [Bryobacteraceae bacterium]|nr:BlaI/MecI/CopY family transcriptional regulator [Bryobacteraceae bacterium]